MNSFLFLKKWFVLTVYNAIVIRKNPSNDAALRFSVLSQKLQSLNVLTRKWATLQCLHSLSVQSSRVDNSSLEIPFSAFLSYSSINLPSSRPPSTTDFHQNSILKSPKRPRRRSSSEEIHKTGFQLFKEAQSESFTVPESFIVRDLLYIFQGIDGQLLKFNPQKEEVEFSDSQLVVPRPTKDLIRRLTELGFLYQKIQIYLKTPHEVTGKPLGLIEQSLRSMYEEELAQYFKLLAVLETSATSKEMTLRNLLFWSIEPAERLRLLNAIVQACQHLHGGALLGAIQTFSHHGDPTTQQFIHHMLKGMCKPFFEMVRRWVYEGDLVDPHMEFFIGMEAHVEEEHWWKNKYVLGQEMVPGFIEKNLARKIFLIGKSLNFLRFRANDEQWVSMRSHSHTNMTELEYSDLHSFEHSISAAYKLTSLRLIGNLLDTHHLKAHFLALKKYLLLCQGDFIQALMDGLASTLSRPASGLYRYHLTSVLESALRTSNAQFDTPDILARLDVRLLQNSVGEDGWAVFSLDYHVDPPLNTVITRTAMQHYLKLFNFLWRMKRAESTLAKGRQSNMQLARSFHSLKDMQATFHQGYLIWSEMTHFIYQMQYYFLFEVLECSWDELMKGLDNETLDLDALIALHNRYLNQIASRGLLTNNHVASFVIRFGKVFDLVQLMKLAQDMLHDYASIEWKKQIRSQLNSNSLLKKRAPYIAKNTSLVALSSIPDHHPRSLKDIIQHISNTRNDFKNVVGEILGDLSNNTDDSLRNLAVRLNFNEYYPVAKKLHSRIIDMDIYQP
ncbi:Gamma-tubulin complex component 3 [Coelomomyces lativittatus]|nr:Gamma-tubulin complex component 3 [Coelomomyces lativittatus]